MRGSRIILLLLLLTAGLTARAQLYRNNFDNGYTWYPPWGNLVLRADSTQAGGGLVCVCDTSREFGLGFDHTVADTLRGRNLHLRFEADFRFPDTVGTGDIALTILHGKETRYWKSHPLSTFANDSAQWFHVNIEADLPNDYLEGSRIKLFLWNRSRCRILVDNAELELTLWDMPSFIPQLEIGNEVGMLVEYIIDKDTVCEFNRFTHDSTCYVAISSIDTTHVQLLRRDGNQVVYVIGSTFHRDCKLLRQALVVPFFDTTVTLYRKNMGIDTTLFQSEYYLDREGFKVGHGDHAVISYHQTGISSTQFDATNRVAYFNLDYWRDHPMIHYPLSDSVMDHFEDVSPRPIYDGKTWVHFINFYEGNDVPNLPRIMQIPYGYESGIIFTEHADWTDIRTHRAVLFGSEKITKAKEAIGGFVGYGIPVTKSVFYNNPDQVTNDSISKGAFKGLHATIQTHRDFKKLLDQLYKLDFDICLHTPEQFTTTPSNLKEALDYMQRHYKSTTWIDHGYNNDWIHNREDLVCDGLNRQSDVFAAYQWQLHRIKYLWNAYYEENRMNQWCFDNNLMQPYTGFGDALPNRQITTVKNYDFLAWCTPSTLEAVTDEEWDFYFSSTRLQKLVDNHDVHITHMYPAWVVPGRTFWCYDADSTIVALPGMNRAFERIANMRDEHKMLPMTIKTYLDYYSGLLHVNYEIVDEEHIRLVNIGDEVKGFTLLCPSPIRFEDNRFYEFRKSGDDYYIWFDLKPNDKVNIRIVNR